MRTDDGADFLDATARAVLDASPDLVVVKTPDFRFAFVNSAYARFHGTTPDAIIGRLDTEVVSPVQDASSRSYRALDEEALAGRTPSRTRVRAIVDGSPRTFDIQKSPLRDSDGVVRGVLTYARDVTQEEIATGSLRSSEERYRLLLEHSPVAMYVHDGKNVIFANPSFARLMRAASPEAMIGYPVLSIAHPDDLHHLVQRLRNIAEGKVVSPNASFRALATDGSVLHVQILATRCVYEGRDAIQVVMVDETERVRAREERAAFEDKLRHGQRLEALGTLSSGIAHDFNNMLMVIVATAELALAELEPSHPASERISELLATAGRAGELVRGILAFGRKQSSTRSVVRMGLVIPQTTRFLRATLPSTVELAVDVRAPEARITADVTQLHQVFLNVVTNAWQSMKEERGQIDVTVDLVTLDEVGARAHPDLRAGDWVCVVVKDDGAGMDEATRARAFDPFFTTKPIGQGTGLGLSVVHGIMREHGGVVTIASELGRGSTLRLWFPVTEQTGPEEVPPPDRPAPPRDIHVLLVDDEPTVLASTCRMLERLGFRVTALGSFLAAREALARGTPKFDFVITDQSMPVGTGVELASGARDVPFLLITGRPDDETRERAREAGIREVIGKPFDMKALKAAIALALSAT